MVVYRRQLNVARNRTEDRIMRWHEDFEDLADECPEDFEEQWLFEQTLNAEAADFRQAEARQAAEALPVTNDDEAPW
jgi:hypothetical protein